MGSEEVSRAHSPVEHGNTLLWINSPFRYNNEQQTSEMFNTAGRTVKSGLVASAVVSSWTWAATLLQSSGVAYRYGVSGPFWVRALL